MEYPKYSIGCEPVFGVGDRVVYHCPVSVYDGSRGRVLRIDAIEPEKATCNIALDDGRTITVFRRLVTREEEITTCANKEHLVDFVVGDRVIYHNPTAVTPNESKRGRILAISTTTCRSGEFQVALDDGSVIYTYHSLIHDVEQSPSDGVEMSSHKEKPVDSNTELLPTMPDRFQVDSGMPKVDSLMEEARGLWTQMEKLQSRLVSLHTEKTKAVKAFDDGKKTYEELCVEIKRLDNLRNVQKKIEDALTGSITRSARNVVDLMLRGGRGSWKSFEELECLCGANRVEEVVAAAMKLESSLKVVEHGGQKLLKVKRFF